MDEAERPLQEVLELSIAQLHAQPLVASVCRRGTQASALLLKPCGCTSGLALLYKPPKKESGSATASQSSRPPAPGCQRRAGEGTGLSCRQCTGTL